MEGLAKQAGYIKGLIEGMSFADDPAQAKLLNSMVDLLGTLCERVEATEELMDDLNDYVESIDDDLSQLESEMDNEDSDFFGDFEDGDYSDDMEDGEEHLHLLNGNDDAGEPETLAGSICPECGGMFFVGMDDPEDACYVCPHCEKRVLPTPLTPENAPIARPVEE